MSKFHRPAALSAYWNVFPAPDFRRIRDEQTVSILGNIPLDIVDYLHEERVEKVWDYECDDERSLPLLTSLPNTRVVVEFYSPITRAFVSSFTAEPPFSTRETAAVRHLPVLLYRSSLPCKTLPPYSHITSLIRSCQPVCLDSSSSACRAGTECEVNDLTNSTALSLYAHCIYFPFTEE